MDSGTFSIILGFAIILGLGGYRSSVSPSSGVESGNTTAPASRRGASDEGHAARAQGEGA